MRLLVALALLGGCREREAAVGERPAALPAAAAQAPRVLYPSAPGSFVDLVSGARHGVVAIRAASPVKSGPAAMFPGAPESVANVALGTGFLIEAKGVYVLTTDHIAAASPELRVVLADHTEIPAKVIGRDIKLDLALLALDGSGANAQLTRTLQPLALGDSDDLHVGEWLVVLGDAFGDELTAAVGVVSSTGREASASVVTDREMTFRTYLQTDARIHRGNSGGPVLDTAGQVVGLAVATSDRIGELSFAIPINRVREIVGALRDYGQVARAYLGAVVLPVTPERAQSLGLATISGALVTELRAGSPAMAAGLRPGDVILQWDHRPVDHRTLPWLVAATPVGKLTPVQIWRNRAAAELSVVPAKMPE